MVFDSNDPPKMEACFVNTALNISGYCSRSIVSGFDVSKVGKDDSDGR